MGGISVVVAGGKDVVAGGRVVMVVPASLRLLLGNLFGLTTVYHLTPILIIVAWGYIITT
jgi:hypothetical protein